MKSSFGRSLIWLAVLVSLMLVGCGRADRGGRSSAVTGSGAETTATYGPWTPAPGPPVTPSLAALSTDVEPTAGSSAVVPSTPEVTVPPAIAPSAPVRPVLIVRWQSTVEAARTSTRWSPIGDLRRRTGHPRQPGQPG